MLPSFATFALLAGSALAPAAGSDKDDLGPAERKVYDRVLSEEFCGCNTALTLAGCLAKRPDCALGRDLEAIVLLSAGAGVGADEVLAYSSQRVLGPYCARPRDFATQGAPSRGPMTAATTVVEFADFRCGHCRAASPLVHEAAAAHKEVRFIFMPFPLNDHPESIAAAEAAMAANAQGKFWPMHDALFDLQDEGFTAETISAAAKRAGLDLGRFANEMNARKYKDLVTSFKQQGVAAELEGTPAFFVNGRPYELDPVLLTFTRRFEMERHRNTGSCQ